MTLFSQELEPPRFSVRFSSPWGTPNQPGAVSTLAIWLIQLGIHVSYSRPYHPQTNGKDERFHRTLKAEVLKQRSFADTRQVQAEFDRWRDIYNRERPHAGIGMATPITRYHASARPMPSQLPPIEYDQHDHVLRVGWNGKVSLFGHPLRLSSALHKMDIAARPNPEIADAYDLYFAHHKLMTFDPNHPLTAT